MRLCLKSIRLNSSRLSTLLKTRVCKGATIGAGAVILPGITIGENAFIAAGSVVTKDVPAGELWMGNPAKFYKKVDF